MGYRDEHIYALRCPLDGKIHYVGRTNNPTTRRKQHHSPNGSPEKKAWAERLKDEGAEPEFLILETVEGVRVGKRSYYRPYDPKEVERYWIVHLHERGHPLHQKIPNPPAQERDAAVVARAQQMGRELIEDEGLRHHGWTPDPVPREHKETVAAALGAQPRELLLEED